MKIFQYLPVPAAKSVINPGGSTFQLRALRCYKEMEMTEGGVSDPQELVCDYSTGGNSELLNNVLVSCWSIPSDDSKPVPEWEKMKNDKWKVAVLSTVDLVRTHIETLLSGVFSGNLRIVHEQVRYDCRAEDFSDKSRHIFCKPKSFSHQSEYRFAAWMASSISRVDLLILSTRGRFCLPDFISKIYLRDSLTEKEKFDVVSALVGDYEMMSKVIGFLDTVPKNVPK
jgi:hypothetical protein